MNNDQWNAILAKLKNVSSDSFGYNNANAGRHVRFGTNVNGVSDGLQTLSGLSSFQVNATNTYINGENISISGSTGNKSLQIKLDANNSHVYLTHGSGVAEINSSGYVNISGNTKKISVNLANLSNNEEAEFRTIELLAWDSANKKFIKYSLKVLATLTGEAVDVIGTVASPTGAC